MSLRIKIRAGDRSFTARDIDWNIFDRAYREEALKVLHEYAPKIVAKAKYHLDSKLWHRARSTGRLKRSIGWRTTSTGITVYAGAPYAKYVEDDTRPHAIYPVRARLLRWVDYGGEVHFATGVKHPGTMGKHMMRDAVNDYNLAIRRAMGKALERAIERSVRE